MKCRGNYKTNKTTIINCIISIAKLCVIYRIGGSSSTLKTSQWQHENGQQPDIYELQHTYGVHRAQLCQSIGWCELLPKPARPKSQQKKIFRAAFDLDNIVKPNLAVGCKCEYFDRMRWTKMLQTKTHINNRNNIKWTKQSNCSSTIKLISRGRFSFPKYFFFALFFFGFFFLNVCNVVSV